jgi:hypothetical protein
MSTRVTIVVNILWLISPLILTVFALWEWRQKRSREGLRVKLPMVLGMMLIADWVAFLHFVVQSETPYGMYFKPTWITAALLLLSLIAAIASLTAAVGRWQLALAGVLILSLWVCVAYAPAHYLSRDFATVTVDDHPVAASVYVGHPSDMEAEAFALVRVEHGGGDYLLDFDAEKVRLATRSEYIRIPGGVWYLKAMQRGTFSEPLPPQQMNQFRVLSRDGRVITVQF